jgi:hypothetical protein
VIPASEGGLAGRYESFLSYRTDGSLASKSYPAAGGLLAEGVSYVYNDLGLPTQSYGGYNGNVDYVTATDYTRYGELQRLELGETPKRAWLSYNFTDQTRRLARTVVDAEVPNPMQSDVHYGHDDAGKLTSIADKPMGGAFDTQCFAYDHSAD